MTNEINRYIYIYIYIYIYVFNVLCDSMDLIDGVSAFHISGPI